ncbi:hypothetical protein IFM89_015047 [Coptis chinensis]|uniref:R13L1/DRL21-like LRR repeat region domain-containing protein n=1 Tax=Coptis chinensis TaxID=261450 RepID=A0A835H4G4_9MAGN|nr:hypothetical protein IFM89_015047 [Coptis chinensis]
MPSGLSHLTSIRTLEDFFVGKGIGCKLNELNGLIHLKGFLRISNLENVSSARDCVEANLKGKHNLETLYLVWNDEGVNRVKIDFDVLGNLEPHQNLKALAIQGYRDNRFPRWMTDPLLPNLVIIGLLQCRNCQNLPALGQLPSLKEVHLEKLDALQFIEGGSVVRRQREWFPSLEKIYLFANPNLESWVKEEEEEVSLHSVVVLSVRNCPKLSTMPMLPSLEKLTIKKCSEKLMLSLLKFDELAEWVGKPHITCGSLDYLFQKLAVSARRNATPYCFKISNDRRLGRFEDFAGMAEKLHFPSFLANPLFSKFAVVRCSMD